MECCQYFSNFSSENLNFEYFISACFTQMMFLCMFFSLLSIFQKIFIKCAFNFIQSVKFYSQIVSFVKILVLEISLTRKNSETTPKNSLCVSLFYRSDLGASCNNKGVISLVIRRTALYYLPPQKRGKLFGGIKFLNPPNLFYFLILKDFAFLQLCRAKCYNFMSQ